MFEDIRMISDLIHYNSNALECFVSMLLQFRIDGFAEHKIPHPNIYLSAVYSVHKNTKFTLRSLNLPNFGCGAFKLITTKSLYLIV